MTREDFWKKETVSGGRLFHATYNVVKNNKDVDKLAAYERSLGFGNDVKPSKIEVDCYLPEKGYANVYPVAQFNVYSVCPDGNKYRKVLTQGQYFTLIKDLELDNPEY